jgi:steroid delta-isomerase-like uncharacterized protein
MATAMSSRECLPDRGRLPLRPDLRSGHRLGQERPCRRRLRAADARALHPAGRTAPVARRAPARLRPVERQIPRIFAVADVLSLKTAADTPRKGADLRHGIAVELVGVLRRSSHGPGREPPISADPAAPARRAGSRFSCPIHRGLRFDPQWEMHVMARDTSKEDLEPRERRVQDNLALMHRYFDLLFSKELDAMLELIDDHIEWLVVPTGTVISGKEMFAAGAKQHWGASPDRVKKLVNLFADENYACMEYVTGGTLTGRVDFGSVAIPPTEQQYELQVCFVFHLKDGKIDRVREYFDMETVRRFPGMAEAAARAKTQHP